MFLVPVATFYVIAHWLALTQEVGGLAFKPGSGGEPLSTSLASQENALTRKL